jgi:hypothetical protein
MRSLWGTYRFFTQALVFLKMAAVQDWRAMEDV